MKAFNIDSYIETPYVSQPADLDFMTDFLPYRHMDLNCEQAQSFDPNIEAPTLFLDQKHDSIACLFENDSKKRFARPSNDHKVQSPSRLYPMQTYSKVFDEDLQYANRRLFNDGIAPSTFPDTFDFDYQEKAYNPLMRQNSILTPTDTVKNPQSTSPSTKKMSDSDETCSQKRLCVRDTDLKQKQHDDY
jgi:hypothetical protein